MPVPYSELTQAQRDALDRLWERDARQVMSNLQYEAETGEKLPPRYTQATWLTKEEMYAAVQPSFGNGCIMIAWSGMWLGIEPDGYTHS